MRRDKLGIGRERVGVGLGGVEGVSRGQEREIRKVRWEDTDKDSDKVMDKAKTNAMLGSLIQDNSTKMTVGGTDSRRYYPNQRLQIIFKI